MLGSSRSISAHFRRSLLAGGAVVAVALGTFALAAPDSGAAIRPMAVPGSVAPLIQGLMRLDDLFQAHSMMSPMTPDTTKARALMAAMAGQPAAAAGLATPAVAAAAAAPRACQSAVNSGFLTFNGFFAPHYG